MMQAEMPNIHDRMPNGYPGMQGMPMDDEDSKALLEEAREWLGDKVDKMGPQNSASLEPQLPKAKTRNIKLDPTKSSSLDAEDAIAIVGVGGKFPGADNLDEFWKVLLNGENHVIEIPPERWNVDEYYSDDYDEPGKTYVRRAGFLKHFDEFDCKMFGISEPEAAKMDPQQRYMLECVHMALEDGGILRKDLNGSKTGVYIGVMNDDYKSSAVEDPTLASNYTLTGTASSIVSARISYVYNLLGPSMSIDTACSSSLVAIHLASLALKSGDCSMAICGGVNSILYPDILIPLSKARMVSPTGQCQAFADTADGYIRGEGGGVVILKKMKEAKADGNKIWATITTGCNQDGRTMTPITAQSVQMQTELLQDVYEANNVQPSKVQYIEAHGTGTPVGDPIEANSLGDFFKQYNSELKSPIKIGSVKSNIGHLESAAGVAGIAKVLLMMKHGKTVKSLHFKRPNPKIDFPKYNMAVTTDVEEWGTHEDGTRISCVNSFGFGGTNSHAIIKQLQVETCKEVKEEDGRKYIIFLSAFDNIGLSNSLQHFIKSLETSEDSLCSIAYTSACRREHFKYRLAIVAESKSELVKKAKSKLKSVSDIRPPGLNPPNIVFVFCGVGTTWTGMCKEMLLKEPVFRQTVKEIDVLLKCYTEWSVLDHLENEKDISDPLHGHLSIFTCQIGLSNLWKHYGIEPHAVVGQSVGEVAAAYVSGVLSLEAAVRVIYHRSAILAKAEGGSMFVVGNIDMQIVEELCQSYGDDINIAVYNSRKSVTVSGDTRATDEVFQKLEEKSKTEEIPMFLRKLDVKCAYHSWFTEEPSIELENALDGLEFTKPKIPLISSVTGDHGDPEEFGSSSYWRKNVRKPVLFQSAVRKASTVNALNIYIEIGPKPVLMAHLADSFAPGKAISIPSMKVNSEIVCMMSSIAELYNNGITPTMEHINPFSDKFADIPKYIPNRIQSLFEADTTKLRKQGRTKLISNHPFMKRQSDDEAPYKIDINTTSAGYVYEHNVAGHILVPGAFYGEVALEAGRNILEQSPFNLEISVEFLRPLRLSEGHPCVAFLVMRTLEPFQSMSFLVQKGNETLARGTVSNTAESDRLSIVDTKKILERCPVPHTKEMTYDTLKTLGFTYGNDLQILGNGYKNETECLVEVTLSEMIAKDLNSTNLHPAVLDGLLQTPGIAYGFLDEVPTEQLLPAGFGSFSLRRTPERNMLAYMNRTSFSKDEIVYNLLLLQTDGIVIAEVRDFVIRSVTKTGNVSGQLAHKIVWSELTDPNTDEQRENLGQLQQKNDAQIGKMKRSTSEGEIIVTKSGIDKENNETFHRSTGNIHETIRPLEEKDFDTKDENLSVAGRDVKKNSKDEFVVEKTEKVKEHTNKENVTNDKIRNKERFFVFISQNKEALTSFQDCVPIGVDVAYHLVEDTTNIQEEIQEKYFRTNYFQEEKELCLIFASGQMKPDYYNNRSILDDMVNESDLLLKIVQFLADKTEQVPVYILTQNTQSTELQGTMNLVGSELWGFVRSILREHRFLIYLIDIGPDFQLCKDQMFTILSGKHEYLVKPELAIRHKRILENEFVVQSDAERLKTPTVRTFDKYCMAEYRSRKPDILHQTFHSLQQVDAENQPGFVKIESSMACLHASSLYPLTFEKAVDALDLWPEKHADGYGVLTFEVIGTIQNSKTKLKTDKNPIQEKSPKGFEKRKNIKNASRTLPNMKKNLEKIKEETEKESKDDIHQKKDIICEQEVDNVLKIDREIKQENRIDKNYTTNFDKENEFSFSKDQFVVCYPMKVQSVVSVPKSCIVRISDLPSYSPGMLRTTCLLWKLVDKLPTKKLYTILTDDSHYKTALILQQLIVCRRSSPAEIIKIDEIVDETQIAEILIPLTKFDLQFYNDLIEHTDQIQIIASLRQFLDLTVERYVNARFPYISTIAIDVDEVLSRTHLPNVVPHVIKWLKKLRLQNNENCHTEKGPSKGALEIPCKVVEIDISSKCSMNAILVPENLIFRKTAVYIIVGGLTGLGWELLKYLAEKGAGCIVSLSRREPSSAATIEIKELSELFKCCITTIQTDITDLVALQDTFDSIRSEIPFPIKGIFQGAGVLDDALFVSMTKEKLQKVLLPKVLGSWNLHLVSRNIDLDYFVMHSSLTSVFGNAGQTNYGAANAFVDSLAHFRRNKGMAGQSINWGPLKVGMAIDGDKIEDILRRRGFFPLNVPTIRKCFLEVLKTNSPQVTYGSLDWNNIAEGLESEDMFLIRYRFRGLVDEILQKKIEKRNAVQLNFNLDEIMSLSREQRMEAIIQTLQILACEVFGVEKSLLTEDTMISSLGIDSMLAMTFAQTVLKVMHAKLSLVMLLTEETTILSLAEAVNNILENGNVIEEKKVKEIDSSVYNSMTPYERRAYIGHEKNKYDPSLYMFGDIKVKSVIAMPRYWKPLIKKIHRKYPALRTLFVPDHDEVRYGVKRIILDPDDIHIDFRVVKKTLLTHKTRHPPNVDDYLFDPSKDLPMRVFYAKKGRGAIMRFLFNHLALDLASISLMMNDLRPDVPETEPNKPIDIAAYIERRLLDDGDTLKAYWNSVIPENVPPMSLTTTGNTETDPDYFEFSSLQIPDGLVNGIKVFLKSTKTTMFQFFTTLFEILLYSELRQDTISIMTTIDCRMFFSEFKNEANRLTNRIPLFMQLEDTSIEVVELLRNNKQHIIKSLDHGYMPFLDIVGDIKDIPMTEIFRHQIVMEEKTSISSLIFKDGKKSPLKVKKLQVGNYNNETILYIWNDDEQKTLELELGCSTLIIEKDRAGNFLGFMVLMIERLLANPSISVAEMISHNMSVPADENSLYHEVDQNVFTKQTSKGWEHKVYLDAMSDSKYLKWGTGPSVFSKRIAYQDIVNVQMTDINDQKAIVLELASRNLIFKTQSKNAALQWWRLLREKTELGKKSPDI